MRALFLSPVLGGVLEAYDDADDALSLAKQHEDVVGSDVVTAIQAARDSLLSARCLLDDLLADA